METLIDQWSLIMNEMVDAINESTSESDIDQIYESITEFIQVNTEEAEIGPLQNLLKKLEEKIRFYAKLQRPIQMAVLAKFNKFMLRLHRKYYAHGATL